MAVTVDEFPDPPELTNFEFHILNKDLAITGPYPEDLADRADLLAISNKNGVAVWINGAGTGLECTELKALQEALEAKETQLEGKILCSLPAPSPYMLAMSPDEGALAIVSKDQLQLVATASLLAGELTETANVDLPFQGVKQLLPCPREDSNQLGMLSDQGALHIVDTNAGAISPMVEGELDAFCWNYQGTAIMCYTKEGTLVEVAPDGSDRSDFPGFDHSNLDGFSADDMRCVMEDVYVIVFVSPEREAEIGTFNKSTFKYTLGNTTLYPSFDVENRPPRIYAQTLNSWGSPAILILAAGSSTDTMVLHGGPDDLQPRDIDETRRAVMPSVDETETVPVGSAMDLTGSMELPPLNPDDDPMPVSPVPIFYVLTNQGTLVAWHCLDVDAINKKMPYPGMLQATASGAAARSTSTAVKDAVSAKCRPVKSSSPRRDLAPSIPAKPAFAFQPTTTQSRLNQKPKFNFGSSDRAASPSPFGKPLPAKSGFGAFGKEPASPPGETNSMGSFNVQQDEYVYSGGSEGDEEVGSEEYKNESVDEEEGETDDQGEDFGPPLSPTPFTPPRRRLVESGSEESAGSDLEANEEFEQAQPMAPKRSEMSRKSLSGPRLPRQGLTGASYESMKDGIKATLTSLHRRMLEVDAVLVQHNQRLAYFPDLHNDVGAMEKKLENWKGTMDDILQKSLRMRDLVDQNKSKLVQLEDISNRFKRKEPFVVDTLGAEQQECKERLLSNLARVQKLLQQIDEYAEARRNAKSRLTLDMVHQTLRNMQGVILSHQCAVEDLALQFQQADLLGSRTPSPERPGSGWEDSLPQNTSLEASAEAKGQGAGAFSFQGLRSAFVAQKAVPVVVSQKQWTCGQCGAFNLVSDTKCTGCSHLRACAKKWPFGEPKNVAPIMPVVLSYTAPPRPEPKPKTSPKPSGLFVKSPKACVPSPLPAPAAKPGMAGFGFGTPPPPPQQQKATAFGATKPTSPVAQKPFAPLFGSFAAKNNSVEPEQKPALPFGAFGVKAPEAAKSTPFAIQAPKQGEKVDVKAKGKTGSFQAMPSMTGFGNLVAQSKPAQTSSPFGGAIAGPPAAAPKASKREQPVFKAESSVPTSTLKPEKMQTPKPPSDQQAPLLGSSEFGTPLKLGAGATPPAVPKSPPPKKEMVKQSVSPVSAAGPKRSPTPKTPELAASGAEKAAKVQFPEMVKPSSPVKVEPVAVKAASPTKPTPSTSPIKLVESKVTPQSPLKLAVSVALPSPNPPVVSSVPASAQGPVAATPDGDAMADEPAGGAADIAFDDAADDAMDEMDDNLSAAKEVSNSGAFSGFGLGASRSLSSGPNPMFGISTTLGQASSFGAASTPSSTVPTGFGASVSSTTPSGAVGEARGFGFKPSGFFGGGAGGAPASVSSPFGSAMPATASPAPVFGASSTLATPTAAPAFGAASTLGGSSAFGVASPLGANAASSPFGVSPAQRPAFGSSSALGSSGSAFGQQSQLGGGGGVTFGGASSLGASSPAFGQTAAFGVASPFGVATSSATSAFGSMAPPGTSAFGGGGASGSSGFAAFANKAGASGSVLGSGADSTSKPAVSNNPAFMQFRS